MPEDEDADVSLEAGDFVYQADQELFLVVTGETDDGYMFSVHGWREISDQRLSEYLQGQHGKLFHEEEIEQVIDEETDEQTRKNFERLRDLFQQYELDESAQEVAEDFAMEDT